MFSRIPDPAALVIIHACRQRLVDDLLPILQSGGDVLAAEGHAEALVCQGMVSASAELLANAILNTADPRDVMALWAVTSDFIGDFLRKNLPIAAGERPPAGMMLQ